MVGFVLRYTPFYSRIQEIVASGELGTILAIDADENLGTELTGLFHKSWRRRDDLSGGFLVEKCCHDFDILNWLIGSAPDRAYAIGKRTHFVPGTTDGRQARFDPEVLRQIDVADFGDQEINAAFAGAARRLAVRLPVRLARSRGRLLDFASGALCTFVACMGQPRTTRRIRIFGTNGELEGNIDDSRIVVHKPHARDNGWDVKDIPIAAETHNHHGGDSVLARRVLANRREPGRPVPGRTPRRDRRGTGRARRPAICRNRPVRRHHRDAEPGIRLTQAGTITLIRERRQDIRDSALW